MIHSLISVNRRNKSISSKFIKFLYCLVNEQWLLPLSTYFFKYTFQEILYHILLFKYYLFINYLFFF